ncbi:MAG: cytochrome c biogenesis protein ResB [Planctomycetes bacterium]|nr:cytochrome c biogenesis protein ResB [Planctomycetota bacterium]
MKVLNAVIRFLGSFGLAAAILFLLTVLTLLGTLAQEDVGLFRAQQAFFESWFVDPELVGLRLSRIGLFDVPIMPGGMLLMVLLFVNLVIGGMVRMRLKARNVGILITHLGIAWLLVAGVYKQVTADEGGLQLFEGEQSAEYVSYHDWEILVEERIGAVAADGTAEVKQWVLDGDRFTDAVGPRTVTLHTDDLPFRLTVSGYLDNVTIDRARPGVPPATPVVDGFFLVSLPREKENEMNLAGCYARAIRADGSSSDGILIGSDRTLPWTVAAEGRTFAVKLRKRRFDMPFTIHLDDFIHEYHPNTRMAKEYQSQVTVMDGDQEVPVRIRMNEPLRRDGMIVFQSSWGPTNAGPGQKLYSGFSVVRNPADQWPYWSLWVITAGMLIHFIMKLTRFVGRELGGKQA